MLDRLPRARLTGKAESLDGIGWRLAGWSGHGAMGVMWSMSSPCCGLVAGPSGRAYSSALGVGEGGRWTIHCGPTTASLPGLQSSEVVETRAVHTKVRGMFCLVAVQERAACSCTVGLAFAACG